MYTYVKRKDKFAKIYLYTADKISELYEAAAKIDPNNEDLLTHLFMSYVRLSDYKKQQQTALVLYKLKPKNPYYFWAVMSIVMQALFGERDIAKSVILPLAERMVCIVFLVTNLHRLDD